jgi:hypothetical protein
LLETHFAGGLVLELKSPWSVYALVTYLGQSWVTGLSLRGVLGALEKFGGGTEEVLLVASTVFIIVLHFHTLATFWREWPLMVNYFNQWTHFQVPSDNAPLFYIPNPKFTCIVTNDKCIFINLFSYKQLI